ncbi:MAG: hypothetical protein AM1032_000332 [Mycoplasmataceae bacterium]|nr:MAG: hypothetical protein AM1032_000332 [Mycoplasmataceae bacterium]
MLDFLRTNSDGKRVYKLEINCVWIDLNRKSHYLKIKEFIIDPNIKLKKNRFYNTNELLCEIAIQMSEIRMREELPKSGIIPKGFHYFNRVFKVHKKAYKLIWCVDENNLNYIGAVNNYRNDKYDEKQ